MNFAFRAERPQDHLSEYAVECLMTGVAGEIPSIDTLQTAWESLKALGNKHIGPKIGSVRVSQDYVLSQIYTRGAWNPAPQHNITFTYQAAPADSGSGRKRMRYLKDNTRMGGAHLLQWMAGAYVPASSDDEDHQHGTRLDICP